MRRLALIMLAALAGCAEGEPFGTPPLTPVGTGLPVARTVLPAAPPVALTGSPGSLYGARTRTLLHDVRASDLGDTLTVVINLDDAANFVNESERERESEADFDFGLLIAGRGFNEPEASASADLDTGVGSSSEYRGRGAIDRAEFVQLRIAVLVTEVLPNGNLLISGSQEIRVNDEVRVLRLAGIVDPLDVGRANTVPYERIAEARISYGGRGRQSEVQSPNWGQQLYDRIIPF